MVSIELAVLATALLLSTSSIFVYSWFESHGKQPTIGIWIIRMMAVFPGLVFTLWAIYTMATGEESKLGMALLTAGMLLVGGAVQLLALLVRKQKLSPEERTGADQKQTSQFAGGSSLPAGQAIGSGIKMKIKRIVANLSTPEPADADAFYGEILGMDLAMDHGWVRTYVASTNMAAQISLASQGGSDTPVPDLSIEVDDIEEALKRMQDAGIPLEYGPASEAWGVRRFYVRDPFGRLINILQHE